MNIENLKIAFIVHDDKANGSTKSLYTLIKGLNIISNINPIVICRTRGESYSLFKNNGIKVNCITHALNYSYLNEKRNKLYFMLRELYNMIAVIKLCVFVKIKKIDIICCNSSVTDIGARAARILRIPYLFYVREFMEEDFFIEFTNKKRAKKLLEHAEVLVFVSKAIEEKYRNKYRLKKTINFPNGFIIEEFLDEKKYILEKDIYHIVQVGALSDSKGTMDSVRMINLLVQNGISQIHFTLVGRGKEEYEKSIKEYINKNQLEEYITLAGWNSSVQKILKEQDILLMNSLNEGFGRVTVEGMLAGLLIVGRNTGGTKEIITNEKTGILYDNEKDFINLIKEIPVEQKKYQIIAKKGQIYAKETYSYINTAKKFAEVLRKI